MSIELLFHYNTRIILNYFLFSNNEVDISFLEDLKYVSDLKILDLNLAYYFLN